MARSKSKVSRVAHSAPAFPPPLAAAHLHAAGIDVGAEAPVVAVPPSDDPQPVRGFGALTADLEALAAWLVACAITPVALESTGVSWIPLFALLEARGFEVLLVEPQQVQKSKGRPTSDVHDCPWSQRLHTFGLLAGTFRPADHVCVRRSDLRQRAMLLPYAAHHIPHRPKALTQMHRKWPHVVRDITGVTGLAILRAILTGERDPGKLAQLRDDRGKHDEATIARALQGHWRDEPLCALAQAVALYDVYHQKITAGDRHIEASLQTFADRSAGPPWPPAPRPRTRGRNQPAFAVREPLHRITGVDLTQSEGLDETTSLVIFSEMGLEMRRWPTVQHCTSWWGLCPHHRVSGGKVLSRRTKPCAHRAATALRLAAACLPHSQSALGAFFRRMKARLGAPKAITATAHTLVRLVYSMRKHGTAYVRQGMDEYEQQSHDRTVQNLTRRAKTFGYTLVQTPEGTPEGALV
jgi:transposase